MTTLTTRIANTSRSIRPSHNFVALLAGTGLFAWLLWSARWDRPAAVFCFVLFGWLTSLALHEFAHAYVADLAGDHSVRDKGYLDLDLTRYVEPLMSIVFPVALLVLGGLGLPGGAVWVFGSADAVVEWAGAPEFLVDLGFERFRFWN